MKFKKIVIIGMGELNQQQNIAIMQVIWWLETPKTHPISVDIGPPAGVSKEETRPCVSVAAGC